MGLNTISNVAVKLWSIISTYIFIPFYIDILGEESYGLVSFFATLQSALNLLGIGLSNTLRREFASGDNCFQNNERKYKLLRSVETIYWGIGIIISALCIFGSDFITNKWLNVESLDSQLVSKVIALMGVSIALQLIANLYSGCLYGMEYQVIANLYCVAWSAAKSVGALCIIYFYLPDLKLFYLWHIITDIIYLLIIRITVSVKIGANNHKYKWSLKNMSNLESIWKYTFGILIISFISLINRQLDKMIISKYLSMTELGAYNIATILGNLSSIIPAAVYTSVFPKFTSMATTGRHKELHDYFIKINRAVNIVLSCMGAFISVYSLQLIHIWTKSDIYVQTLGIVSLLVVMAVTLIEYQEIPYALVLAYGNTKINVTVGIASLPIVIISTYLCILNYGLLGAGLVYVFTMALQTVLYQYIVCKKYAKDSIISVIVRDTLIPLCLCYIIAHSSKLLIELFVKSEITEVIFAVILGGITLISLIFIYFKKSDLLGLFKEE